VRITLEDVAGGVGDALPPKLGVAIVFGSPLPEPNDPEHAATAAPSTTQAATAVETRARLIARKIRAERSRVRRPDDAAGIALRDDRARPENAARMLKLSYGRCVVAALTLVFAAAPLDVRAAPADEAKAAVQRFVDGMNAGDPRVLSLCAQSATVVDDLPPYVWTGTGACNRWISDLIANIKETGTTAMHANFDAATTADVHDKTAYVVYPARFTMTTKGVQASKTGVMTFVMELGADGWKFTHVTWARTAQTP
jgi:ketosteroid isomerase-like protein